MHNNELLVRYQEAFQRINKRFWFCRILCFHRFDRSHAPAWEHSPGRSSVHLGTIVMRLVRFQDDIAAYGDMLSPSTWDAGASLAAFPRWSVGTIVKFAQHKIR